MPRSRRASLESAENFYAQLSNGSLMKDFQQRPRMRYWRGLQRIRGKLVRLVRRGLFSPLPRRSSRADKIVRGVDQADVRKGLGEIAEQALADGVELFCEQAEIVTKAEQAVE